MLKSMVTGMIIGFSLFFFSGCAAQKNAQIEKNWGRSYESMVYSQVANPDAGTSLANIEGINGQESDIIMEEYLKTFKRPSAPKRETITILTGK